MKNWKSSPQSNSNASDGTQILVDSRYHWTNFWFRSLRSLFGWGHLLFANLVWTYDSQMLVILRFCIFSCIFESWQTRCQLQNSHKVEIDREIAPPPNAYFGDLHSRKIFLPTGRSFNQIQKSWLKIFLEAVGGEQFFIFAKIEYWKHIGWQLKKARGCQDGAVGTMHRFASITKSLAPKKQVCS